MTLRPYFNLEHTDLIYSTYSASVTRKPTDVQLFVTTSNDYEVGESVSIIGASGRVVHNIRIDSTHLKVYVENVSGTFTNTTLTGATSGTTGTITNSVVPVDGHLVTLPYEHAVLAQNKFASKTRNVVDQLQFAYAGELILDPPQDTWVDITASPDVQLNFEGNQDAWQNRDAAFGYHWDVWETHWMGVNDESDPTTSNNVSAQGDTVYQDVNELKTTTTTQRQTQQGLLVSSTPENAVKKTGSKVTQTDIVPFMRSIVVSFVADRLKPDTVVYPFFDGESVTEFCRPLDTAAIYDSANYPANQTHAVLSSAFANGDYGDELKTDENGRVAGQFRIPANKFRVGSKPFRLCDDDKNRSSFITTAANETFYASGITQINIDSIVSTRLPRVGSTTISDSRTIQDSTSTDSIIAGRNLGTVQNTAIDNSYTTLNNTSVLEANTVIDAPVAPIPPCEDCDNEAELAPIVVAAEPWGFDEAIPSEQIGPDPDDSDETVVDGVIDDSDGSGYTTRTLSPTNIAADGNWLWDSVDPTAQTFFVSGMPFGTFLTKVDLYFESKSETLPITVQIRNVVNGYPGNTIVPFGSVTLYPDQINVSDDSTDATEFAFPAPVYLKNNTEYCIVILPAGNNPEYNIWVSELGENAIGALPVQRISEQPFAGVLFVSTNNNTWTEYPAEDLKFTLYRASFTTNSTGSVYLKNAPIDYLDITITDPDDEVNAGDSISSVFATTSAGGTGVTATIGFAALTVAPYTVGSTITVAGVTPSGYNGTYTVTACTTSSVSFASATTGAQTVAGTVTGQQGVVQHYDTITGIAKVYVMSGVFSDVVDIVVGSEAVEATVNSIEKKLVNNIALNASYVDYTPNRSNWSYRATASDNTLDTVFTSFTAGHTIDLTTEMAVYSYSDEVDTLALPVTEGSLMFRFDFYTLTSTVSPIIDLRKTSTVVIANYVNDDSTGETGSNGNAYSKYITRQVVLDEGQDAEDLVVYLTQNTPSGTSIEVYAKLLNGTDDTAFESRPWTQMSVTVSPTGTVATDSFPEYVYGLPTSVMTGLNGEYQYTSSGATYTSFKTFAVKIVLLSANTAVVPRIKDLRAIALQI